MTKLATSFSPGERIRLDRIDTRFKADFEGKDEGREALVDRLERLHELQEAFYADSSHALLVVLQAMDTAGKDGTIEHVMGAFNPQGVEVTSFKVPTREELAHDFLWRIHRAVPRRGIIGIFNRSHYEDVLVVRVRQLVAESVWRPRFEMINQFESLLAANRTKIVKIFLHISPEEQHERLHSRQVTPHKQWKFNPGDLEDRKLWSRYQMAYEDALTKCNTEYAPWWVVPADRKWFRNLAVSEILIEALEELNPAYPKPEDDIDSFEIPDVE